VSLAQMTAAGTTVVGLWLLDNCFIFFYTSLFLFFFSFFFFEIKKLFLQISEYTARKSAAAIDGKKF
jgi:hypothetical protein